MARSSIFSLKKIIWSNVSAWTELKNLSRCGFKPIVSAACDSRYRGREFRSCPLWGHPFRRGCLPHGVPKGTRNL